MDGHAGRVCPLCFDTEFSLVGGFMFCNSCGTQLEDFVEEQLEFEDTQITTKAHSTAVKRPKTEEGKGVLHNLGECSLAYVACLQALLEQQVRWALDECKAAPGLEGVVREIWQAYVLRSGLLEFQSEEGRYRRTSAKLGVTTGVAGGQRRKLRMRKRQTRQCEFSEQEKNPFNFFSEEKTAEVKVEIGPRMMKDSGLQSILWAQCPPSATLEILFLGMLIMREAIQPCDLVQSAARAELPYLTLPHVAAPVLSDRAVRLPGRVLRPRGVPTVNSLIDSSASLATLLALTLPPINAGALLHRYGAEMELPKELAEAALSLAQVHLMGTNLLYLRLYGRAQLGNGMAVCSHPYAHLMAALVLAARLAWGLDGGDPVSGMPARPHVWQEWAMRIFRRIDNPMRLPLSAHQALALSQSELGAYLDYCKGPTFGGTEPKQDAVEKLTSLVRLSRRQGKDRSPIPPRSKEAQETMAQLCFDYSTSAATISGADSHVYTCFWGARAPARLGLHKDYAVFLAVAARLVWIRAPDLHNLIVKLERDCVQCED